MAGLAAQNDPVQLAGGSELLLRSVEDLSMLGCDMSTGPFGCSGLCCWITSSSRCSHRFTCRDFEPEDTLQLCSCRLASLSCDSESPERILSARSRAGSSASTIYTDAHSDDGSEASLELTPARSGALAQMQAGYKLNCRWASASE